MALSLTVRADTALLRRQLSDLQKRDVPFAAAGAATDVAFKARAALQEEMKRVFKDPVAWTLRSVVVDKAEAKSGKPARVRFEEFSRGGTPAGRYLAPQIGGGGRVQTPFEQRLGMIAGVLQPDEYLVPARYAERKANGNLNPGQLAKILADLGGLPEARLAPGRKSRGKRRDETYVLLRGGAATWHGNAVAKVPPGIYLRAGANLYLVFLIVAQPQYKAIFDFSSVVKRVMEREFAAAFRQRLDKAWASSRYNPLNRRAAA